MSITEIIRPEFVYLKKMITNLSSRYKFLKAEEYGKSCCKRELYSLRIGDKNGAVLYAGAFHGQEWITSLILLRFCERLCNAIENEEEIAGVNIGSSIYGRGIVIIPSVNPDGVEIALRGASGAGRFMGYVSKISGGSYDLWNANARGVDINHNFNAGWDKLQEMEISKGIKGPSPRQYGGKIPESEPETSALVKLCREANIRHVLAAHSQGEEIYWKYGEKTPSKAMVMAKILSASSGYTLQSPDGLASHGGFKDWFIEEFERPGFTIEVGKGKNPLPLEQFEEIYSKIEEMLLLAAFM